MASNHPLSFDLLNLHNDAPTAPTAASVRPVPPRPERQLEHICPRPLQVAPEALCSVIGGGSQARRMRTDLLRG